MGVGALQEFRETAQEIWCWLVSLYTVSEIKIMAFASMFGAFFSSAVGGVDQQMQFLIYLVIADYVTGVAAGIKTKQFGSAKGFKGVIKKVMIFVAVSFAFCADQAMGIKILRSMALFGFAATEATSIVENIDRLGYGHYIPGFIRDKLVQIREEKGVKL